MNQNSPCYNGDVACNTLFIGESGGAFRLDRLPSRLRLQAPIAGSPTHHGCYINEVERFLGREHTWLDMFLTEPPVTTARLTLDLPARRFERGDSLYFNHNIANELVHDARGLTFRTIMRRANEVFQFGHWRTPRLIFGRPLKAFVVVHLFAGT